MEGIHGKRTLIEAIAIKYIQLIEALGRCGHTIESDGERRAESERHSPYMYVYAAHSTIQQETVVIYRTCSRR